MTRVAVAMSGGVDSSVAAVRLIEEGHDVVGVTMRLTPDDPAPARAEAACLVLDIRQVVIDLSEEFERMVIDPFVSGYADARTPNPCVVCNDLVKFGILLERVLDMPVERMASGHYARIRKHEGHPALARPVDLRKDQTYFLFSVGGKRLDRLLFPLGDLTKSEVRAYARELGLPAVEHDESQETCFTHGLDYARFVAARHPEAAETGPIITEDGRVVGMHQGIASFTIGQRRGLGVSGGSPLYVLEIRSGDCALVVGPRERLLRDRIEATDVRWHSREREGCCDFRFRHGTDLHAGMFVLRGDRLTVKADEPVEGVAPGQALVCYKEDAVIGGGTIRGAS